MTDITFVKLRIQLPNSQNDKNFISQTYHKTNNFLILNNQKGISLQAHKQSPQMNLYLTVIGLISTLSCILIIICINSKTSDTLPNDSSKSPIKRQGLSEAQKNQILMIVCVIFFMSLVTTNVKTTKFSVMVHNMMISDEQNADEEEVKDLGEVFYGRKGNCEFRSQFKDQYPNLHRYLSQSSLQQVFLQNLTQKNTPIPPTILDPNLSPSHQQTLLILQSPTSQTYLPFLCQDLCHSKTPVLYLNPKHKLHSEQELMHLLKMNSYSTLKQSICKINGIEVNTEMEKAGRYVFETETYEVSEQARNIGQNAYLIIDNFQNVGDVLVYDGNVRLIQRQGESGSIKDSSQQTFAQFGSQYQTFAHKLLFDLIQNCRINVILHTNQEQSNKLYNFWQQLTKHTSITNPKSKYLNRVFPFVVYEQKGVSKLQLQNMLKQMIEKLGLLKNHQQSILRQFQKSFSRFQSPQGKKSKLFSQSPFSKITDEQFSLAQIEMFFQKLSQIIGKDLDQNKVEKTKPVTYEETIAQINGLLEEYLIVRSQFSSRQSENGVTLSGLKKKVDLKRLIELESFGLVRIRQGRAYLLEKDSK